MNQFHDCRRSLPALKGLPLLPLLVPMVGMALLCASLAAHATLGGDIASINQDNAALHGTVTMTNHDGYADYVLQLPNHGVVHEFADASGHVFQVSWGQYGSRPNMTVLLGDYVARFSGKYNGGSPLSRRADRVDRDFELHSKVVNRYFSGSARLPNIPNIPNIPNAPIVAVPAVGGIK